MFYFCADVYRTEGEELGQSLFGVGVRNAFD
jgi:hypothetical protein